VKNDLEATHHLTLHQDQYNAAYKEAQVKGLLDGAQMIGDPPPDEVEEVATKNTFVPREPKTVQETGLNMPFLFDMVLRTIYNRGRLTGGDLAAELKLNQAILTTILPLMRKQALIDVVGQRSGMGDAGLEYE